MRSIMTADDPHRYTYTAYGPSSPDRILRRLVAPIAATIAVATGGLVFLITYLGFLAVHYPWYENVAVVLSTAVVVPVALASIWVFWGLGVSRRWVHDWQKSW